MLGHDVVGDPLAVRRRIGLAGQFAAVDEELTGRENVEMIGRLYRLSAAEARARAADVLERFSLTDAADRPVSTYSGGMRRRLDLGASLTGRPPVILLDEPTTGLDPRTRQELWDTVDELRRDGTTVLLTTQYLEEADRLAQRIAVVEHGRIAAEGTAAELKATVGSNVLVLRLADAATTGAAAAALTDLGSGDEPIVDSAVGEIRLAVAAPNATAEAVSRLHAHRFAIASVELQQPSLDDVFLTLTGPARRARDPRRAPGGRMSTLAIPQTERRRLTLSETITDSRVMATRQLRKTLRKPMYLSYVLLQPVMFVLLFRYVFGGAIDTGGVAYVDFLLPGIIVQSVIFGALMTGLGLTEDLKAGVVDRFRSLPIARSAVLLGRTAADLVVNAISLAVMVLVGLAVGFRPSEPAHELALAFVLVLGFAYAFSWISALRRPRRSATPKPRSPPGFIWVFPLTFASSAFVPAASMPGVVQTFAEINPVTLAVDASRALTIGGGDVLTPALGTLAWLAVLLLLFVPLSVRAFRRA